jgi:putative flippase GtrA
MKKKLMTPALIRFLKYATVGAVTFALDLVALFLLVELFSAPYTYAAGGAFMVAISINYVLSRKYVFVGSSRSVTVGYTNFLAIAGVGILFVVGGMYVLVTYFGLYYLVARVAVAGVTSLWNYSINLFFNFKVAGVHEM